MNDYSNFPMVRTNNLFDTYSQTSSPYTIPEWNFMYQQFTTFVERMNSLDRQYNINQRREFISQNHPENLIWFKNKKCDPYYSLDGEFINVARYMCKDTNIDEECVYILLCAHIASGCWGKITILNNDHRESSVIQSIAFANSGQRKSRVMDKLIAPINEFQNIIKKEHGLSQGTLSKNVISMLPKHHAKEIISKVDFNNKKSIVDAINATNEYNQFYKDIENKLRNSPNINISGTTPYALANSMVENGETQVMFNAEGTEIEKFLKHKDIELILKSYGQESYTYQNMKHRIELQYPALYLAIFAQLDIAENLYTSPRLLSRGIMSRLIPYINISCSPISYSLLGNESDIYTKKNTTII